MGSLDIMAMVAALMLMFAAVIAKVLTAQFLGNTRRKIARISHDRQQVLNRLKMAQNQRQVVEHNKASLQTKRNKLLKRMNHLKRELGAMANEEEARRQRAEMRKVES